MANIISDILDPIRPERIYLNPNPSPDPDEPMSILPQSTFPDLYTFAAEGRFTHHRLNHEGRTELYILIDGLNISWDLLDETEKIGVDVHPPGSKRFVPLLLLYEGSGHPWAIEFPFEPNNAEDRYAAIRLIEQNEWPLFFLGEQGEDLYLGFASEITVPAGIRQDLARVLRQTAS